MTVKLNKKNKCKCGKEDFLYDTPWGEMCEDCFDETEDWCMPEGEQ